MAADSPTVRRVSHQLLFDAYGALLTARQREALRLHLEEDWSMSELASARRVSRSAAHDLVRRGLLQMERAEERLGLAARLSRLEDERRRLQRKVARLEAERRRPAVAAIPPSPAGV